MIDTFLGECSDPEWNISQTPLAVAYHSYVAWCFYNYIYQESKRFFANDLRSKGFVLEKRGKRRELVVQGLKLSLPDSIMDSRMAWISSPNGSRMLVDLGSDYGKNVVLNNPDITIDYV